MTRTEIHHALRKYVFQYGVTLGEISGAVGMDVKDVERMITSGIFSENGFDKLSRLVEMEKSGGIKLGLKEETENRRKLIRRIRGCEWKMRDMGVPHQWSSTLKKMDSRQLIKDLTHVEFLLRWHFLKKNRGPILNEDIFFYDGHPFYKWESRLKFELLGKRRRKSLSIR